MTEVVLIRGLPGSGKSTYAQKHFPNHKHYEADMYFIEEDGTYFFNWRKLNDAHEWCQEMFKECVFNDQDVVITNTFTQDWEFDQYFIFLSEFPDVSIRVIDLKTQFQNIHGVPEEKMEAMRNRWHEWEEIQPQFKNLDIQYEVVI